MPARRPTGLDPDAVESLRSRLADGKKPRVQFSGPQFPEGATGTVVKIGDPAADGTDFITVRVTVNGVADELAFAPAELHLPGQTKSSPPAPAKSSPPAPAKSAARKPAKSSRPRASAPAATAAPAAPQKSASAPPKAPTARRPRKAGATPTITVTLTSSDASWTLSASRGARTIAKAAPLTPGVVTAIAELLGQQAVSAAIAEVNETALAEAEARATQLRAELAELDAVLATHKRPGRRS